MYILATRCCIRLGMETLPSFCSTKQHVTQMLVYQVDPSEELKREIQRYKQTNKIKLRIHHYKAKNLFTRSWFSTSGSPLQVQENGCTYQLYVYFQFDLLVWNRGPYLVHVEGYLHQEHMRAFPWSAVLYLPSTPVCFFLSNLNKRFQQDIESTSNIAC